MLTYLYFHQQTVEKEGSLAFCLHEQNETKIMTISHFYHLPLFHKNMVKNETRKANDKTYDIKCKREMLSLDRNRVSVRLQN